MAVTNLFSKFLKKESPRDANYLSLTLTPDRVLATIWALEDEKIEVLGFCKKSFQNVNSIVHQTAVAIDTAAEKAKTDVSEAVFGLSGNWFEDGKLKRESGKILKKLSEDLDLSAQAFVSLASSIKNKIKIDEGVTPQMIVVGIFDEFAESSLIKNNEVISTKTISAKINLEKILGLIKQLANDKSLPSRIVVYGVNEESKIAQDLTNAKWDAIFLNLPKIDFLGDSEVSKSVAYAQASDVLGHEPTLASKSAAMESDQESIQDAQASETNEFGFIEGEDILKTQAGEADEQNLHQKVAAEETAVSYDQSFKGSEETAVGSKRDEKKGLIDSIATLSYFSSALNIFKSRKAAKKLAIGALVLLAALLLSLPVIGKTITSAEVVIKVDAKSQDDSFDVDVVLGSSNFSRGQIAGSQVKAAASGNRKTVATGKKEVGQKAKGEVTVFNWTTSKTELSSNTVIISKNGVKFTLDSDIEVASRSASTPGEGKANVSAVDFGTEGNVGAGTDFSFQQYDELLYSATASNAFTGGDKKEVTVVSQEDLDKLEESLAESLKQNAISNLKNNLGGSQINEDAIVVKTASKTFDKKLEEETSLVNLDLEVEASTISYSVDELKNFLAEESKDNAPENLEAKSQNIEIINLNAEIVGSTLNLTGKYKANYVPKFDEESLKKEIAQKSVKETREIIKKLPQVSDVNVNFSPSFLFAGSTPKNPEKIKFKIESK